MPIVHCVLSVCLRLGGLRCLACFGCYPSWHRSGQERYTARWLRGGKGEEQGRLLGSRPQHLALDCTLPLHRYLLHLPVGSSSEQKKSRSQCSSLMLMRAAVCCLAANEASCDGRVRSLQPCSLSGAVGLQHAFILDWKLMLSMRGDIRKRKRVKCAGVEKMGPPHLCSEFRASGCLKNAQRERTGCKLPVEMCW